MKKVIFALLLLMTAYSLTGTALAAGLTGNQQVNFAPALKTAPMVSGYVYDPSGGRISGATVRLGELVTSTNSNGHFVFSNVKQGVYTITAEKTGYRNGTLYNTAIDSNNNSRTNLLSIPLIGLYTISVSAVKDQAGASISPVVITVQTPGCPNTAVTLPGPGLIGGMAGLKEITVAGTDSRYLPLTRRITVIENTSQNFILSPRLYTISGVVTDTAGSPIPGISVIQDHQKSVTRANGSYSLTLPAGPGVRIRYNPSDSISCNRNYQSAEIVLDITQNLVKDMALAPK